MGDGEKIEGFEKAERRRRIQGVIASLSDTVEALKESDPKGAVLSFYEVIVKGVIGLGVLLVIFSGFAPEGTAWVLAFVTGHQPAPVAELLRLSLKAMLAFYGMGLITVGAALHLFSKTWLHARREDVEGLSVETVALRFIVVFSFAVGFLAARVIVAVTGVVGEGTSMGSLGPIPLQQLDFGNYHIHHYFYGVVLLGLVGYIAVFRDDYPKKPIAVLYGLGMGVFVDEIGMLLTEGEYFAESTYFFAVGFVGLFLLVLYYELKRYGVPDAS